MEIKRHTIWPFVIVLMVFLASSQSSLATPKVGVSYDKLAHFLVFGLFATTIIRIPYFSKNGWKGVWLTIAIVSGYGILDEFRQSFTPGRSVEFNDWVADTLGAIVASVLYFKWNWYRQLLEFNYSNIKKKLALKTSI